MFNYKSLLFSLAVASLSVEALPAAAIKRIDQSTPASTTKWVAACQIAGDADSCSAISEVAIKALLADSDPCAQQDAADQMIKLAKTLQGNEDMISLAKIFIQQPRNPSGDQAVPYCQKAPQNAELNGFYQCQFKGVTQDTFTGNLPAGDKGTIPFGLTAPVNPAGSCPANPSGPIADGAQLTDITSSPGSAARRSVNGAAPANDKPPANGKPPTNGKPPVNGKPPANGKSPANGKPPATPAATPPHKAPPATTTPLSSPSPAPGSGKKRNGSDARSSTNQRAPLTPSSPCINGQQTCIGNATARCVGGKFVLNNCPARTVCTKVSPSNQSRTLVKCAKAHKRDINMANLLAF